MHLEKEKVQPTKTWPMLRYDKAYTHNIPLLWATWNMQDKLLLLWALGQKRNDSTAQEHSTATKYCGLPGCNVEWCCIS